MSKKTHDRELERARQRRLAEQRAKQQRFVRLAGVAAILVLAVVGFAVAATSGGDDAGDPGTDAVAEGFSTDEPGDEVPADEVPADEVPADEVPADEVPADPGPEPVTYPAGEPCEDPSTGAPESPRTSYDAAPPMTVDPAATYVATVETTCGTIVLELDAAMAPATVNNFVFLAREGYYDGAPFHRVIEGFMIQGGDPSGTGHGEQGTFPGYTFADELALAEQVVAESGHYPRGTLAMANAGPDTNGSQFFIMQSDYPLPPQYAVFGRAVEGLEVVDRIVAGPVAGDQAVDPVRIVSIEVTEA